MHGRIRDLIDVRLRSVRSCEYDVVSGVHQGHRRNNGFVEIIAGGTGATALHLDPGGVGTDHKDFAFCHGGLLPVSYRIQPISFIGMTDSHGLRSYLELLCFIRSLASLETIACPTGSCAQL